MAPLFERLPVAVFRPVSAIATPELLMVPFCNATPVPDPSRPCVVSLWATLPFMFVVPRSHRSGTSRRRARVLGVGRGRTEEGEERTSGEGKG